MVFVRLCFLGVLSTRRALSLYLGLIARPDPVCARATPQAPLEHTAGPSSFPGRGSAQSRNQPLTSPGDGAIQSSWTNLLVPVPASTSAPTESARLASSKRHVQTSRIRPKMTDLVPGADDDKTVEQPEVATSSVDEDHSSAAEAADRHDDDEKIGGHDGADETTEVGSEADGSEDDEQEDEDEDDEEDEEDADEEPRLKYTRLTQHLNAVYRNADATSSFLVSGDKQVYRPTRTTLLQLADPSRRSSALTMETL